ncbi:hypothetical protein L1049_024459 [Liquidambar formosana]|uniref:Glycosyltransferase n=1 Tax=Liquidambar formosana TaxID=63359 RepID=A0AAP0RW30_LIQFO
MGNMKCTKRAKIVLVPYPAQGHVTPMLKLGQAFLSHGFEPVMVTPEFIHQRIISRIEFKDEVVCMSIPDGLDEKTPRDFFAIEKAMENNMPAHLECLVHKLNEEGGVVCIIVDLLASWAIKVAKKCAVPVGGFWPAMLATYRLISAIPDMVHKGLISETGIPQQGGSVCFLPGQPMLNTEELPWLIGTLATRKSRFKFWTRTLDRSRTLPWLLVNSFPEGCNENESMESSRDYPHVFPVGPLNKLAVAKNPSFWEEDMSCLDWLDKQKPASVVYVSFGSWVGPIGEGKVKNLALGLESSGQPFLWVLGPAWREGLPAGYVERVSKQGQMVSWAPQMEVLQHKAVGCYLTHCGWNSTMEAIQCQKRLLCYPVAGDQFVNCAYIVEVWKIGVKMNGFERKDVEEGVRRVMEDNEMNNKLMRLNEKTMGDAASSRVMANLTDFIDDLKKLTVEHPVKALCSLNL